MSDPETPAPAAPAPDPTIDPRVKAWLDALLARLAPGVIRVESGENLAAAVARVLDLEEQKVRSSQSEPELRAPRLQALESLRANWLPPAEEHGARPAARAGEMLFELRLDALEETALARLADVLEIWTRIVEGIGVAAKLPPFRRQEYGRVRTAVVAGAAGREIALWFRGTREMVVQFRTVMGELGLQDDG